MPLKERFRVRLKAYDQRVLDQSATEVADAVKRTGGRTVSNPFPRNSYQVLRSPRLDEKSQEQFDTHAHKRLVDIVNPTQSTIDALAGLDLPPGVGVEIKKVRSMRPGAAVEAGLGFDLPSTDIDLIQRGLAVLGSPEKLARWMQSQIPALRGQTPYSLLESEEGRKQVATVLGRIEHGIY